MPGKKGNVQNPTGKGGWVKGQSGNRAGSRKLMPPQREAYRLLKEATPQAIRKLVALMDCGDLKVEHAAAKTIADKGLPKEVVENIYALPEGFADKPIEEQVKWVEEKRVQIAQIAELLRAELNLRSCPRVQN